LDGLGIFITWLEDQGNLASNFRQFGFNCCHSWWQTTCITTLPQYACTCQKSCTLPILTSKFRLNLCIIQLQQNSRYHI
jgi:hypothetical protein